MTRQQLFTLLALVLLMTAGAAAQATRFAVIGDFGWAGVPEADVSALVHSWAPEFIVTTGDNNYDHGSAATIDTNIGKYYHDFIYPYTGAYGPGAAENKFFPCLGNHDWEATNAQAYLDYFTLPGIERYYDFVRGPVHFYSLDVDPHEPHGIDTASVQASWLKARLASDPETWKIVYMHHSPFSSCSRHGSYPVLQWPYARWGASAVFSGHDHTYERIHRDGIPYFVNGLGGKSIYPFATPVAGSQVRYNANYGAMLVEAVTDSIVFKFITRTGVTIDRTALYRKDTAQVALTESWNLLSLPMGGAKRPVGELFPGASSGAFVYRDNDFQIVDSLEPGSGFWLKFPSASLAKIPGDSLHSLSIPVQRGWNIVGGPTLPFPVSAVSTTPAGILTTPFYGYSGLYQTADTLAPGAGYWVRASEDGTIILTLPAARQ